MSRRLRIAISSAVILLGLLVIAGLSFVGVTHTGFGQERVRQMVASMLAGRVKGKVHIGRIHGGFFNGVTIDYVSSMQGSGFTFKNPNSTGGCGCGSSFNA